MDIDDATPAHSRIKAFLFDTYATFRLYDHDFDLRLCIGITKAELIFKMEHGPDALLAALKHQGIYPYTDFERDSAILDAEQ